MPFAPQPEQHRGQPMPESKAMVDSHVTADTEGEQ